MRETERGRHEAPRKKLGIQFLAVIACAILAVGVTAGVAFAFLTVRSPIQSNQFLIGAVSCECVETDKGIMVRNTGNSDAYIRVRLVSCRVNENGQRIGGEASIAEFSPGAGWGKKADGCYYYSEPVAPGELTGTEILPKDIALNEYEDSTGGRQKIEVLAEAIQADPERSALDAWGFAPGN